MLCWLFALRGCACGVLTKHQEGYSLKQFMFQINSYSLTFTVCKCGGSGSPGSQMSSAQVAQLKTALLTAPHTQTQSVLLAWVYTVGPKSVCLKTFKLDSLINRLIIRFPSKINEIRQHFDIE